MEKRYRSGVILGTSGDYRRVIQRARKLACESGRDTHVGRTEWGGGCGECRPRDLYGGKPYVIYQGSAPPSKVRPAVHVHPSAASCAKKRRR